MPGRPYERLWGVSQHTVRHGETEISFELDFADRKTMGISVHPEDLRVTVTAPAGTPLEDILARVSKRAGWILAQQADLARYWPPVPPRRYVAGETHWYLGRKLRLKVHDSPVDSVKVTRHILDAHVRDESPDHVREVVHDWYRKRAKRVFAERLAACMPKARILGIPEPELRARSMDARWGTTTGNVVTLNTKLVQAPVGCIDYVIYHELAHLSPDAADAPHGPAFQAVLRRLVPDWRERRAELNTFRGK